MATLSNTIKANIIRKLLTGQNYRDEIITLLDAAFLDRVIEFFKKVVGAKLKDGGITSDWYKKEMLSSELSKEDIAYNAGLNLKTISNIHKSAAKKLVIDVSGKHYDILFENIKKLTYSDDINLKLTISLKSVHVDLTVNETLIVINAIAVMRAGLRGGLWSTAGKQVEKPLMEALCRLLQVPETYFDQKSKPKSLREIDYYLNKDKKYYKCEVKLMGQGNPESADVVDYRSTKVLVADRLSTTNKKQLSQKKVKWVAMDDGNVLEQFAKVLKELDIPFTLFKGNLKTELETVLKKLKIV